MTTNPNTYPLARPETLSLKQWLRKGCPLPHWVGGELLHISSDGQAWTLQGQGHTKKIALVEGGYLLSADLGDKVQVFVNSQGAIEHSETLVHNEDREGVREILFSEEKAMAWTDFLRVIRLWFAQEGLVEVTTPSLVVCPGLEPSLDPLSVDLRVGTRVRPLFLPTSPELHLKKLLAFGWTDLFEIRSCFRDDEVTEIHQPEFTMLEWYRAYAPFSRLSDDLLGLISWLEQNGQVQGEIGPPQAITVRDLYRQQCGVNLTPETTLDTLGGTEEMTLSDALTRLWVEKVDPWLEQQRHPILVSHFHPSQAALARINSEGWADRVELYWRGLEIANGFNELNDPKEQRQRFLREIEERRLAGKKQVPMDQDFLWALEYGMPPSVGMALGLERLWMAAQNLKGISEIKAFSITRE